ncbi:helix-turn-helix transcriptional regulator [Roseibium sp. M-1]
MEQALDRANQHDPGSDWPSGPLSREIEKREQPQSAPWLRVPLQRIEDLSDAVLGAGLEAIQFSRAQMSGSLIFQERDGITYGSGLIKGKVGLKGPLSQDQITFGIGLDIAPGTSHWHCELGTGNIGLFLPGDEHNSIYASGSLYATLSLSQERLEALLEARGIVLNDVFAQGTGFHEQLLDRLPITRLARSFADLHSANKMQPRDTLLLGPELLEHALVAFSRPPVQIVGISAARSHGRIVAKARAYIDAHLHRPLTIEKIQENSGTSRRTLYRAFADILDETPQSYTRKLRLHRLRQDLAKRSERQCTIAIVANDWGVTELGRFAGWYRNLFGELPSETLARGH